MVSLPADLFGGLIGLETLNLHGNSFRELDSELFSGLISLDYLALHSNFLETLPKDIFDGLSSLDWVRLDRNSLTSLPEDLFDGLTNFSELWLEQNYLTGLPENLFTGLDRLELLDMSENWLSSLPENVFDGLGNLDWLSLGNNRLTELPEDLFDGLGSLDLLSVRYNQLTELPEDLFDGLGSLTSLDLWHNKLTELPEDLFDGLGSLRTLDLRDNHLGSLPEDIFDGLGSLRILELQNNRLTELPAGLFDHVQRHNSLVADFTGNDIRCFPEPIVRLAQDGAFTLIHPNWNVICGIRLIMAEVDETINESDPPKTVTVTASLTAAAQSDAVDVAVSVGSAFDRARPGGVDYTAEPPSFTITIAANTTTGTGGFTLTPVDDDLDELDEKITIRGSSSDSALPVTEVGSITIVDDDISRIRLTAFPSSVQESGEPELITVTATTASGTLQVDTSLTVSVRSGTATEGIDFDMVDDFLLTIPANQTTGTGTFTLTPINDRGDEPDETVLVTGQLTGSGILVTQDEIRILDDDEAPRIVLTAIPPSVGESDAATTVTVIATINTARTEPVPLTLSVGSGTATEGADFAEVDDFLLTILANQTTVNGTFRLTPINDGVDEPDETILVTGRTSTDGITVMGNEIIILDDDEPVALAIQDLTVQEDAGVARVPIGVTPAAPTALRVTYETVAQTATEGLDYTSSQGTLEIPSGSTTAVIDVPITDDSFMESSETFQVRLSDAVGAVLSRGEATVTIEDNDVYRLRVLDASAIESASALTFAVTLDPPNPAEVVRVDYETVDGTAMATADYVQQRGTLEFPIGAVRREVSVPLIDDTVEESPETFLLRLSAPEHALLADAEATGTIRDDDALPVVNIVSSLTVQEDAGRARFAVTRSRVLPGRDTEVSFTVTDESAEAPVDYQVLTSSPVRIISGQTTAFIEVQIIDDAILEADETFRVQLTDAQNGVLGQVEGLGTIVDNEDPVTVSIQDVEVNESAGEAVFPVTLSGLVSTPRNYTYTTVDETAVAGEDYASSAGSVTFAAGALRQEVRVAILDDLETEETETFLVRLSGAGILDGEGRGTIQDDDAPLTVSIHDGSASEGAGSLRLPVRLNRASSRVVTVQFSSSDETASAVSDYATSRGMVIFEQGSTEGSILVQVVDDADAEPEETFQVTLSSARHAAIVRGVGTGTILDNEGSTAVSVQGVTMSRRAAAFEVRLSTPSALPVTVSYASEDGTAKAGQDYEPSAGHVTFAPGEVSKTVGVKLLSSEPMWHAKTFSLVLLSAVNAELHEVRREAVMEEEVEKNVLDAYVSRMLRTGASHVVEALSRRTEGLSQCRVPELSWLRYGTWRPSAGELFAGCGALFTQAGWSVWGQGAFTRLHGMEGALSLRSDVTTMMVGVDRVWSSGWMAGVLAAHSLGSGSYEVPTRSGTASSRLTGVYPYVSYHIGTGIRAWLLVGLGRGDAEVEALESDLGAGLVALGASGTLTHGAAGRLGYEADVLMAAAEVAESSSRLWVRRVRTGIEGSLHWGPAIQPYVEAALRHDSGDAETGLGLELGGGMRWSASQLRAEVGGRTLVVHTAEGMREWGLMAAVEYGDAGGLGPTAKVRPMWGSVYGGNLWRDEPIQYVGQGTMDQRMEMELGYGTRIRKSLGRSIVGMTLDQRGRAYRIGYNLHMTQGLQFSVTARAMDANRTPRAYGLSTRMNLKW